MDLKLLWGATANQISNQHNIERKPSYSERIKEIVKTVVNLFHSYTLETLHSGWTKTHIPFWMQLHGIYFTYHNL